VIKVSDLMIWLRS